MRYKIIIFVFSAILLGLTSCNGCTARKQNEHNPNTHTHADGTVHSDHAPEHETPQQESFKVEADHDHSDHNHK